jgi:hypothetical protein
MAVRDWSPMIATVAGSGAYDADLLSKVKAKECTFLPMGKRLARSVRTFRSSPDTSDHVSVHFVVTRARKRGFRTSRIQAHNNLSVLYVD